LLPYKTQLISMSLTDIKSCWTTPKYTVLPIHESNNGKRVCNPTLEAGSPTPNGNHICTGVGGGLDGLLLRPLTHLSLGGGGDSVVEEPTAWKIAMDKTHSFHMGKEEFLNQTPRVHRSTERICTYPAFVRVKTCKCQIKQYSYMRTITHTFVRETIVSTSDRAWMSWLFDVGLFIVVIFQNGKMRTRSIGTTSVRVFFPLPSQVIIACHKKK
jgi:hypothetical protein